jgi:KUP system potassium uptake protein
MRADNDGEGGILALMSLLGIWHGERAFVIALGIIGAAMLYGDGTITPSISVLSALEGLKDPLLLPTLRPGNIVVMDNLGSHRSKAVRQLRSGDTSYRGPLSGA